MILDRSISRVDSVLLNKFCLELDDVAATGVLPGDLPQAVDVVGASDALVLAVRDLAKEDDDAMNEAIAEGSASAAPKVATAYSSPSPPPPTSPGRLGH